MPATRSHLQLDTYFLKELSYSLKDKLEFIPERVSELKPVELAITDITTQLESNAQAWRCELIIESSSQGSDENSFYEFKIVMIGFFKVNPKLSAENAKILAETNCPAVLYSTSREIVATITRRSPYPVILLPLVTFIKTNFTSETPKDGKPDTESKTKKTPAKKRVARRART
jgi:preprotein translocase subunit SecB